MYKFIAREYPKNMIFVIIGAVGFVILFLFDPIALQKIKILKPFIWLIGNGLIFISLNRMMFNSPQFIMPKFLKYVGIAMSVTASPLLVYSLLIEIPFKTTYLDKGAGSKLITTGTYALVRHPGVLWLILLLIGFFLISGSKTLLVALPIWIFLDILYIILQDRYFFIKQFGEAYEKYQKEVPMLIPSSASIKRCICTFLKK